MTSTTTANTTAMTATGHNSDNIAPSHAAPRRIRD